jgi:uncharacterized ferritin-like protein (DUF455 family)
MEIREFAQRVLFANTLADKLAPPSDDLTDLSPGSAILSPALPGRPDSLRPRRRGERRVPFPGEAKLIDEESRARLLHFFCNHELLAVELMALALLKFPDAPKAFRRGIARTLREEQEHTRWYLRRMGECGLNFGDLPVSGMIWDHISGMESPLDFVSRLSLTFEQSNLDYARHFGRVLATAGDAESAAILGRIYRDEIAHVGHGLKWLRRWKEDKESDWDAFRRGLKFPLSPVRAKGLVPFNEEGRRLAGLDADFIERLRGFEQSRGRTPDVRFFHPAAEDEWAAHRAGRPWHPRKTMEAMADDLEIGFALALPRDDVLLARRLPTASHRLLLESAGLFLPELVPARDAALHLAGRRLHAPRPWAWSPSVGKLLDALPGPWSATPPRTDPLWFDKTFAASLADRLEKEWQCPETRGTATAREAVAEAKTLLNAGWPRVVAKASLGLAGRGHFHFAPDRPFPELPEGGYLVEPWLPRCFDFSAHYDVADGKARWIGLARQSIDARGRWRASATGPKWLKGLAPEIASFADQLLPRVYNGPVREMLDQALARHPHDGPLGVDAFVWQLPGQAPRLHAMVEINPRWTMGRLALSLAKKTRNPGWTTLSLVAKDKAASLPAPEIRGGRLLSGHLPLTDPATASRHLLLLCVGTGPAFGEPREVPEAPSAPPGISADT